MEVDVGGLDQKVEDILVEKGLQPREIDSPFHIGSSSPIHVAYEGEQGDEIQEIEDAKVVYDGSGTYIKGFTNGSYTTISFDSVYAVLSTQKNDEKRVGFTQGRNSFDINLLEKLALNYTQQNTHKSNNNTDQDVYEAMIKSTMYG